MAMVDGIFKFKISLLMAFKGVYFAKEGTVSLGNYSRGAHSCWRGSAVQVNSCVALAEIVNLPQEFVSQSPFFVVNRTDWIIW